MNDNQSTEELWLIGRLNEFHNQMRDGGVGGFDAHQMLEWLRENYLDDLTAYKESTAIEDDKLLYNRVGKMMDELVNRKNNFMKSKDKAKSMNIGDVASPTTIWRQ
jgi:hypothetical protein